ncbi:S8 family serine peptidase [Actinoplanes sp. NBRC 101535]|uniref:S8 family peptidase n=1 Tax=Actinoplanes sp. NBRC 101535 TaxID=3032196 RepID=UPI0024A32C5F|nr:S8 family serine peptidase [Actinoplanes sp. NBRC 101535]GLY03926.1 hypothetical protein Acsp01_43050 [Actinoplanes sp. NBRC 101535]
MSDVFPTGGDQPWELTGSYVVLLAEDDTDAGIAAMEESVGTRATDAGALGGDAVVVFDEIGVAVVTPGTDRQESMLAAAAASPAVLAVEPERFLYPVGDYLSGYADGVNDLVARLRGSAAAGPVTAPGTGTGVAPLDESRATWGLQATRVLESCRTGNGVRVAVLDTGMAPNHPDFADRIVKRMSFVPGEDADDQHGHGTHCVGTACGSRDPKTLPRYGVAPQSEIFAGKVLGNSGRGTDRGILAGIDWAVTEGCRVISMSLGAPARLGDTYSKVYEEVARRAQAKGTIIVAAAGNESRRPGVVNPVGHPANCPSIMAVAAVGPDQSVAWFSCSGQNPDGGQVDVAAPGVDVLSSVAPDGYRRLSGTSMATPHVAGILALLAEADPGATPAELWVRLQAGAKRLQAPSADVGAGLVQAP